MLIARNVSRAITGVIRHGNNPSMSPRDGGVLASIRFMLMCVLC